MMWPLIASLVAVRCSRIYPQDGGSPVSFKAFLPGPQACYGPQYGALKFENVSVTSLDDSVDLCGSEGIPEASGEMILISYINPSCQDEIITKNAASKGYKGLIYLVSYCFDDRSAGQWAKTLYFGCKSVIPLYVARSDSELLSFRNEDFRIDLEAEDNPALTEFDVFGCILAVISVIVFLGKLMFILQLCKALLARGFVFNLGVVVMVNEAIQSISGLILLGDISNYFALFRYDIYAIFLNCIPLFSNISLGAVALAYRQTLVSVNLIRHNWLIELTLKISLFLLSAITIFVTLTLALLVESSLPMGEINIVFVLGFQLSFFVMFVRWKNRVYIASNTDGRMNIDNDLRYRALILKYSAYTGLFTTISFIISTIGLAVLGSFDVFSYALGLVGIGYALTGVFQLLSLNIAHDVALGKRIRHYLQTQTQSPQPTK